MRQEVFFIVGVGRSGTSLLQSILSSHSEICLPPETGFLRNAFFSLRKHENKSLKEVMASFPRLKRMKGYLKEESVLQFTNEIELYRFLLDIVGKQNDKPIVGDKDPRLIEYLNATSELFPDAKFIHLVRDPRDVLLSKKKAEWSKDRSGWYHIFANYVQLKMGEYTGKKLGEHRYKLMTYEQILDLPEETFTETCKFLGVDFEKGMLSFQDKAKELVSEEEKQWKKETMGPLLKDNTGKWEGNLKPWEVVLTESMCWQAFKIGEYEKSNASQRLSALNKFSISILSLIMRGFGNIYMLYRIIFQRMIMKWKQ